MFDEKTQKALGYYVYMLIDPRDDRPFYVGKGVGNRIFNHVKNAIDNPTNSDEKCDVIRKIGPGKVRHVIVTHGLATETEAPFQLFNYKCKNYYENIPITGPT